MAITAVFCLIFAIIWEIRHRSPIVNIRLFGERNFALCCIVTFFVYAALYASTVLLPQMLQTLMGYSATQAGLVLSPAGLVTMLEMPIIGILLSRGMDARWLISTGLFIVAIASFWMASLNLDITPANVIWPRIVQVLGAAMMFVPINTIAFKNIPRDQTSNASGLFSLIRNEGSGIGVALVTTLFARFTQIHRATLVANVSPLNPNFNDMMQRLTGSYAPVDPTAWPTALRMIELMVQRQAAILTYLDLFRLFAVVILLVIPLVFLMRKGAKPTAEAMAAH
jgi:DHA2 family multidrug resistance protein